MEVTIDSVGRIVLPKVMRESLGFKPGTTVDISMYGNGIQIIYGGRTASLIREDDGRLVARGEGEFTDDDLFALVDAGRK